jgi:predicted GNAT superfamily acetyltransferase
VTVWVVKYRRAIAEDYPAILRLHSANFIENLSPEERKEGFLSAKFTSRQIAEMAEDLGTTIASVDGAVVAFLCAFRNEFNHGSPVIAKMRESYDRVEFDGKALSSYHSYIYGPVCIDRTYRRRGLLRGLYEAQKQDLGGRFEVGVAFVSRGNPYSVKAHVAGLGMTEVGDFELKGNVYVMLAFRVPPSIFFLRKLPKYCLTWPLRIPIHSHRIGSPL